MFNLQNKSQILLQAIIDANQELAVDTIVNWAKKNGYQNAFTNLFEPVLNQIGNMWLANKLSLAQGYFAGKIAEEVFTLASQNDEFTNSSPMIKGDVVIGNIEDDFHSLGRRLVGTFLKTSGWIVHDLGNDILAQEFVDKAIETNSKIIGVSAMMYTTAINIKKVREELDKRNLSSSIKLVVGGAVFKLKPELVKEVGGDATSDNAIKVASLFDTLCKKEINT